jgi:hypothetical protein
MTANLLEEKIGSIAKIGVMSYFAIVAKYSKLSLPVALRSGGLRESAPLILPMRLYGNKLMFFFLKSLSACVFEVSLWLTRAV